MTNKPDSNRVLGDDELDPFGGVFAPPSSTLRVEFGARSSRGTARQVNEDHYLITRLGRYQETIASSLSNDVIAKRFDEYGYAMVVADGMGAGGHGELASRLALVTLVHLVRHFGKWNLRIDNAIAGEIMERVEGFYRHVDSSVVHARKIASLPNLQTTLTAVFGAGRDIFFAHVGHSRAYLLREGKLLRLTRDHTIGRDHTTTVPVAPLIDVSGTARDLVHVLTDTIGMGGTMGPTIDIERFRLLDRDIVLVCTNGLTDTVDEAVIAEILASNQSPDTQCRELERRALSAGSDDDVTVLIAQYHLPEEV